MRPRELGDVVVRARGLARHLLDGVALRQLVRAPGTAALARALEDVGYWPAPSGGGPAPSTAHLVERSIDHEILARLAVLVRWLAERAAAFAPLFELEERDALRIGVRRLVTGEASHATGPSRSGWPALRAVQTAAANARDLPDLARRLGRSGHPYAPALAAALRGQGGEPALLERALDATWAERATRAVRRGDPALAAWVGNEIDLHNAWSALCGTADGFLAGGPCLPAERQATIAALPDAKARRRELAAVFHDGALAEVFEDSETDLAMLEAHGRASRITAARRNALREPLGASPIIEVVLRLQTERTDLRCIAWGVASGLAPRTIVGRLAGAR